AAQPTAPTSSAAPGRRPPAAGLRSSPRRAASQEKQQDQKDDEQGAGADVDAAADRRLLHLLLHEAGILVEIHVGDGLVSVAAVELDGVAVETPFQPSQRDTIGLGQALHGLRLA